MIADLLARVEEHEAIIEQHKVALTIFERRIPEFIAENAQLKADLEMANKSCADLHKALVEARLQIVELRR